MHELRDLAGKRDTAERMAPANRLIGLATSVAEANDALVVCGDFNVEQDSNAFDILAEARLYDLVTTHGFSSTRNAIYKKPVASRATYW
jgi:endonuclease/exonuclease/phosphatase family metal-dependent hydrolase